MNSASYRYWKKREAKQYQNNIRDLKEYDAYIDQIYQRMVDEINKEIDIFYGKYADKEGISMAAAKRRADKLDIEEYARKAKRYVKEKDFSKEANEEMRLYNMTMRVNRLELLKSKIGLEMVAAHDDMKKYFGDTLTKKAREEFRRQAGILGETIFNNDKMARSIVNASFHNATWSQRIWAAQDELRGVIDKELQRGLIRGLNPLTLTRNVKPYIKKGIDSEKYAAERLMRTELARVQTDAQFRSYEEAGYSEYVFIANGRTACHHCMKLDGKHFPIIDMEISKNAPPMHPNCMCSTAPWMDRDSRIEGVNSFYTYADPMREKMGSAYESHPNELKALKKTIKSMGVRIIESGTEMKYGPNSHKGEAGVLRIDPQASYSAWLHEYKHIQDDKASGWNGMAVLMDINKAIEWEDAAYNIEIEFALKEGYNKIAKRLEWLKGERRREVRGEKPRRANNLK